MSVVEVTEDGVLSFFTGAYVPAPEEKAQFARLVRDDGSVELFVLDETLMGAATADEGKA